MLKLLNSILDKKAGLIIFLWLATFAVGVSVPSAPFRNGLVNYSGSFGPPEPPKTVEPNVGGQANAKTQTPPAVTKAAEPPMNLGVLRTIGYMIVVFLSFTPTNLAILCILGSMLGAKANAKRRVRRLTGAPVENERRKTIAEVVPYPALNGLCVFFALMAGQIVIQGELKWDDAAPNMYFRLAATATLFSVIAGMDPHFIAALGKRLSFANNDQRSSDQRHPTGPEGEPPGADEYDGTASPDPKRHRGRSDAVAA